MDLKCQNGLKILKRLTLIKFWHKKTLADNDTEILNLVTSYPLWVSFQFLFILLIMGESWKLFFCCMSIIGCPKQNMPVYPTNDLEGLLKGIQFLILPLSKNWALIHNGLVSLINSFVKLSQLSVMLYS